MSSVGLDSLTSWYSPWAGTKAVVVGLGATGFAVVDTLIELGVDVQVVAADAASDVRNISGVLGARLFVHPDGAERAGAMRDCDADFAVVSPGVARDDAAIAVLEEQGIALWSELDFAWRVRDKNTDIAEWVVVVGSATAEPISSLATRILLADGRRARHVGFGQGPLLDALRDPEPYETLLISASENSVGWWHRYPEALRRPLLSVCIETSIGITSGALFDGTTLACLYRRGVGTTEGLVVDAEVVEGARAVGIGLDAPGMSDLGVVEGILCDRAFLEDRAHQALEISTTDELREAGWSIPEDLPSVLAAIAIARATGVSPDLIAGVVSLP